MEQVACKDKHKIKHDKMATAKLKKDYKETWAKEQYGYCLVEKSHEDSFRKVQVEKGTYMTFGGLVIDLGGWQWPPAVAGAKAIAFKNSKIGGDWCKRDEQSGLPFFLRLNQEWREELDEQWKNIRYGTTA